MSLLLYISFVASSQSTSFVDAFVVHNHQASRSNFLNTVNQRLIQQHFHKNVANNPRSIVLFDQIVESTSDNIPTSILNDQFKIPPRSVVLVNTTNDDDSIFQESRYVTSQQQQQQTIEPIVSDLFEIQNSVQITKSILEVTEQQASTLLSSAAEITQQALQDQLSLDSMRTVTTDLQQKNVENVSTDLPTKNIETKQESGITIIAPSVMKIIQFAIPAIGVWLCNPILSLIDTSVVGLLSGVSQQAALNPATAVTDYAALLIAFMYTGSTNLMAAAREKYGIDGTRTTFRGALQLSTYVGLVLGVTLLIFSKTLLRTIIGNDNINPDVFVAAMKYVKIRSLGMPAAAFIGSAQAACLGMQDIKSPLYVLVAAALVNLVGDIIFVPSIHPWIGGAAGAAWATVFSQYAAASLFYIWLTSTRNKRNHLSSEISNTNDKESGPINSIRNKLPFMRSTTNGKSGNEDAFSTRGFLQGKLRKRDLLQFPPKETIQDFSPYVIPVTSTQVGRVSGYVAMSHVVSSSLGTFNMAAQQVIVSLFYCLCPIADSLSLTAQSFLPSIYEKSPSIQRTRALNDTIWNFMKAGAAFGLVLVGAVSFLPLLSTFFTPDTLVSSLVNSVVPLLVVFFAIHGLMCSAEGLLMGQKDLAFLGRMYASFFVIVPYFMMKVKDSALSGNTNVGLTSVWTVFVSYQVVRVASWVARVFYLNNKTNNS
jgi:Na+-driven multidrug efflux pump